MNPIFIVSCGRCASTAILKILSTAKNCITFNEPEPKLCIEQRLVYEYGINAIDLDSLILLKKNVIKRYYNKIYIDKNQNYIFFYPYFEKFLNAKIIILFRDAKDVIRSYMDWVNVMGKRLYMSHEDSEKYTYISPCDNPWDYSLFRPKCNDRIYEKWKNIDLFEKFCWYWAKANEIIINNLKIIDNIKNILFFDSTQININKIYDLFVFCNLKGFNQPLIESLINKKINSIEDRIGISKKFPIYDEWDDSRKKIFHYYTDNITKKIRGLLNGY